MPWFGGGTKKTGVQPPSNLQIQKTKQVESLKNGNLNVKETIRDVEYRVSFQAFGSNLTLVISLPPQFPLDKPTVTVEPAVRHPWVDQQNRVTKCPNLMNFSVHSSLLTAIQVIIEEFKVHPPALATHIPYTPPTESVTPGAPSMFPYPPFDSGTPGFGALGSALPSPPVPVEQQNIASSSSQPQNLTASSGIIPDIRQLDIFSAFPDLKNKSHYELMELVEEEDKILDLIQQMPQLQQIATEREKISCRCSDLANENLAQKPKVEELKQTVKDKAEEFERLRHEFEQNQERQLSLMDQFHPSAIQNNLKVAIMEAEEESEKCVEDYLSKKMDTETFTQTFIEKRTLYHSRRAKEEKLNQIVIRQGY